MAYRVKIDPDVNLEEQHKELARLMFNLRYHTIEFRGSNGKPGKMGLENHVKMGKAENDADKWIRKHVEGINEPFQED